MSAPLARLSRCALLLACCGGAALPLAAQVLLDPTQPPAALQAPSAASGVVSGAPVLQSVLVSRNDGGRRLAVIDGQMVRVGGKVGDAVVLRIRENEVDLQRGQSRETLKLFSASALTAAGATKK